MPSAPPRLCRCGALIPAGQPCPRCSKATAKAADRARGSARQRGYDGEWEAVRAAHLARHPGCIVCGSTDRVDVDHKTPIRLAPHRRLDPTNLQTLCRLHHNRKTHGRAGG